VAARQLVRMLLVQSIPAPLTHEWRVNDPLVGSSLQSYALEQRHSLRHLQRACRAGGLASPASLRSIFRLGQLKDSRHESVLEVTGEVLRRNANQLGS
jgi:hypothetical protein